MVIWTHFCGFIDLQKIILWHDSERSKKKARVGNKNYYGKLERILTRMEVMMIKNGSTDDDNGKEIFKKISQKKNYDNL